MLPVNWAPVNWAAFDSDKDERDNDVNNNNNYHYNDNHQRDAAAAAATTTTNTNNAHETITDPYCNHYNNNNNSYNGGDGLVREQPVRLPPRPPVTLPVNNSLQLFVEYQIQMLRRQSSVSNILDIFLDMKLSQNIPMREEVLGRTTICYHLSQMILEIKTTLKKTIEQRNKKNNSYEKDTTDINELDITMHHHGRDDSIMDHYSSRKNTKSVTSGNTTVNNTKSVNSSSRRRSKSKIVSPSTSTTTKSENGRSRSPEKSSTGSNRRSSGMYRRPFILESDDDDEGSVVEGEDEIIIRKAFKLIADLTYKDKSGFFIQQFAMNGTVTIIAKRMKQFRQNEALQEEAFMILLYISFANFDFVVDDNNANAQPVMLEVFNDTVLTILLDTMNGYSKNQKLQHGALTMLRMISSKCMYMQVTLIEQFQVVERILKIFKSNWKDLSRTISSTGCELLKLLTTNSVEARNRIRRQKGSTLLLARIEDRFRLNNKDVADLALDVFTIVCSNNPELAAIGVVVGTPEVTTTTNVATHSRCPYMNNNKSSDNTTVNNTESVNNSNRRSRSSTDTTTTNVDHRRCPYMNNNKSSGNTTVNNTKAANNSSRRSSRSTDTKSENKSENPKKSSSSRSRKSQYHRQIAFNSGSGDEDEETGVGTPEFSATATTTNVAPHRSNHTRITTTNVAPHGSNHTRMNTNSGRTNNNPGGGTSTTIPTTSNASNTTKPFGPRPPSRSGLPFRSTTNNAGLGASANSSLRRRTETHRSIQRGDEGALGGSARKNTSDVELTSNDNNNSFFGTDKTAKDSIRGRIKTYRNNRREEPPRGSRTNNGRTPPGVGLTNNNNNSNNNHDASGSRMNTTTKVRGTATNNDTTTNPEGTNFFFSQTDINTICNNVIPFLSTPTAVTTSDINTSYSDESSTGEGDIESVATNNNEYIWAADDDYELQQRKADVQLIELRVNPEHSSNFHATTKIIDTGRKVNNSAAVRSKTKTIMTNMELKHDYSSSVDGMCEYMHATDDDELVQQRKADVQLMEHPKVYSQPPNNFNANFNAATKKFVDTGKKINTENSAVVSVDENFYVFGGDPATNKCWLYHYRTNTWESLPPMMEKRCGCGAAIINGNMIYITGGENENKNPLNTVEIFNCQTQLWTSGPTMIDCHDSHTSVSVGSQLYVLGGFTDGWFTNRCEMLAPPSLIQWMEIPEMPYVVEGCAAVSMNQKLFVIGGCNEFGYLDTMLMYDTITMTWSKEYKMNVPRYNAAATIINSNDNTICVLGGQSSDGTFESTVEVWNGDDQSFTLRDNLVLAIPKCKFGITKTNNKKELIAIGGDNKYTKNKGSALLQIIDNNNKMSLYNSDCIKSVLSINEGYRDYLMQAQA